MTGHKGAVLGAAVLEKGDKALSCSDDGVLKLWNLKTGKRQVVFTCDFPFHF
jgi:WD40 repeat protein